MNQSSALKLGSIPVIVLAVVAVNQQLDLSLFLDPERLAA